MAAASRVVPTNESVRSSFSITSADGKPLAIPAGEYYFNTKARARRMMQNSLSSHARQVYACLELATMGFQQECAVVMDKGRKRPLTPDDISSQTGLSRQHTRRALAELEDEGLAERRADDEGDLRKGHVEIYSWATPREPKCKPDCSQRAATIPDWFPESWTPLRAFIKRQKLSVVIDQTACEELLAEGDVVARGYKEAEIVVARFLERVCAQPPLYKEEITERTEEKEQPVGRSVLETEERTPEPEAKESLLTDRQKEILEGIPQELLDKVHDDPLPALIDFVDRELKDAPLKYLTDRIEKRFDVINSLGVLPYLAGDARRIWEREQKLKKLDAPQSPPPDLPPPEPEVEIIDVPVSTRKCPKCRGEITEYQSGFISWCRCGPPEV